MKPKDRMRFLILLLGLEFLAASYDVAFTKSSKHILRKWNLLDKTLVKDKVRSRRCHLKLRIDIWILSNSTKSYVHMYKCCPGNPRERGDLVGAAVKVWTHSVIVSLIVSLTSDF